jgi:hypothetical protein
MFSADLLTEVMLVNHLAWRNKLLKNNILTVKKQHLNRLASLSANVARPLSGFWYIRINPSFVF